MNTYTTDGTEGAARIKKQDRLAYYRNVIKFLGNFHGVEVNPQDFQDVGECRAIIDDLLELS